MTYAMLDQLKTDPVFQAAPAAYLVLDLDLRIRAANPAYTTATLTSATDLDRGYLFDAFPDNPADAGADGVANLSGSLERVLREGRSHTMGLQRYDVPAPADRATFVPKVWAPINVPLRDPDGRVVGILHHVEDITDLVQTAPQPLDEAARALARLQHAHRATRAALRENRQLREALRTRGVIEQAKGILIGQRGCSADDAFTILVGLSQRTNIKLRDIAQALIDFTVHGR